MSRLQPPSTVPRISVLVNNYNYGRYLQDAIDSAAAQLGEEDEIIVVDDGSSDGSSAVLDGLVSRPQVQVHRQRNAGQLGAVCAGLALARGDWVALLDSDDLYCDGYLARLREYVRLHPRTGWFFSRPVVLDQSDGGRIAQGSFAAALYYPEGPVGPCRLAASLFCDYVGSSTSGLVLRGDLASELYALLHDYGGVYRGEGARGEGPELSGYREALRQLPADAVVVQLAAVLGYEAYSIEAPGFFYRMHANNAYASLSPVRRYQARLHQLRVLRRFTRNVVSDRRPTLDELVREIRCRTFPVRRRRRLMLAAKYAIGSLKAQAPLAVRLLSSPIIFTRCLFSRSAGPDEKH